MTRFPLFHAFSCSLLALASQALGWQTSGESVPAVPQEFRAAWISTVHNIDWPSRSGLSGAAQRAELLNILNTCAQLKLNAVFLQVRPNADALYRSSLEPWSQWLSGPGVNPGYDPLAFAIQEAHRRGIELHAWFNPFRAKANVKHAVGRNHISLTRPDLMKRNGSVLLMNPSASASRDHALKVIMDVVRRYDIDGVHLDDYFYPYPTPGRAWSPASFGDGKSPSQRRGYIDDFVQDMYKSVKSSKPWVRVGISPFGIYRNKKSTPDGSGSNTNGLQNYDDLYADVARWVKEGWIDYNIPQIYWEIGHPAADYITLIQWWNKNATREGTHLYIGQNVARTMKADQLTRKMLYERSLSKVKGNCFWPANEILWNNKGVADSLKQNYHRYPALIPAYTHLHNRAPQEVKKLKAEWTAQGYMLHWQAEQSKTNPELASYFVIYRFENKESVNLDDPSKIVAVTRETNYLLPYDDGKRKYRYVVTAVDRFHNENQGKSKKVKL